MPVYRGRSDEMVGVLLLKDLLRHRAAAVASDETRPPIQLRSLLLPPVYVPQSKPAHVILREFLALRQSQCTAVGRVQQKPVLG